MIFVENLSKEPKFSSKSNVEVTITDGVTTSKNMMDITKYGGQDFWIAGCYKVDNGTINFSPESSFLNGPPDKDVPDYCLRFFGLQNCRQYYFVFFLFQTRRQKNKT